MITELEQQTETVLQNLNSNENTTHSTRFKKVWDVAKPFLSLLSGSFFIPKKFRALIRVLIVEVDFLLEAVESIGTDQQETGFDETETKTEFDSAGQLKEKPVLNDAQLAINQRNAENEASKETIREILT